MSPLVIPSLIDLVHIAQWVGSLLGVFLVLGAEVYLLIALDRKFLGGDRE